MKHMLSINYIVLVLGCLDGYLKSIWETFCMHILDENMFNNIIEVYDMEIVMNERPFTATDSARSHDFQHSCHTLNITHMRRLNNSSSVSLFVY